MGAISSTRAAPPAMLMAPSPATAAGRPSVSGGEPVLSSLHGTDGIAMWAMAHTQGLARPWGQLAGPSLSGNES